MEPDLPGAHADRADPILAGLVVPRPIARVTTLHEDALVHAAPFPFFIAPETLRIRPPDPTPVGRMGVPGWYCHSRDLFEIPRPA